MMAVPIRVCLQGMRGTSHIKSGINPFINVSRRGAKDGSITISIFRRATATVASNEISKMTTEKAIPRVGKYIIQKMVVTVLQPGY